jgi:hypothetical protein
MFRIEELKTLSCNKFKLQLQKHWISDTFAECIREVYLTSNSTDLIRKAVVDAVLLHRRELVQKRPFQDLVREGGDFAIDIMLGMG